MSFAVPAKRGVVKTLRLADGTEARARLVGDETMHYYVTEEGKDMLRDRTDCIMRLTWLRWRRVLPGGVPK